MILLSRGFMVQINWVRLLWNDAQPQQIQSLLRNRGSDGPEMDPRYRNIPGSSSRKLGLSESAERRPKTLSTTASVSAAPSQCHFLEQFYTEMFWAETQDLGPPVVASYEAADRLAGTSANVLTALVSFGDMLHGPMSGVPPDRCDADPGQGPTGPGGGTVVLK